MRIKYYLKIWLMMSKNSFLVYLMQKKVLFVFLFGKMIRFLLYFLFIFYVVKASNTIAGYDLNQIIFFYITFVVVDAIAQLFFREVYRFRPLLVSGDFDLILVKPVNALFRVLLGGTDVIDLMTMPPLVAFLIYYGHLLNPTPLQVVLYIVLVTSGLIIAAAFHIFVLGLGIITMEIDHTIMAYRDLSAMGRFPVDIYNQPLRGILTYIVPIGIMVTLPVKILLGVAPLYWVVISFFVGFSGMYLSLKFWNYAIKKYTSASS